jgi:hypothetical protein
VAERKEHPVADVKAVFYLSVQDNDVSLMTAQQIEHQIEHILATETDASRLSRRLFDADGLFGQLAHTGAERRTLIKTSLFRQAQQRLTELQRREAAVYAQEPAPEPARTATGASEQ